MKTKWILQTNIFKEDCIERMVDAFERLKVSYELVKIIPFSDELPKIEPHDGPVVAYGTTTLLRNVDREKCWYPGMWYDSILFKPSVWGTYYYSDLWLNDRARYFLLSEFEGIKNEFRKHGQLFIRPDSDLKLFDGDVFDFYVFEMWYERLEIGIDTGTFKLLNKRTEVLTSPVVPILSEWRYVICNRTVIAGSRYKLRGRLYQSSRFEDMDEGANELAKQIANRYWQLSDVYVVDICQTQHGYKMIELNTFNAAGLYDCDVMCVIHYVSEQAEKQWNENWKERRKMMCKERG